MERLRSERAERRLAVWNAAKTFGVAAVLCIASSIAQAQNTPDTTEQTIEACLTTNITAEALSSYLQRLGWQRVANTDLTEAQLSQYAARRLSEDMAFGQASAVRWKDAWQRALKNSGGLRRLVVVEGGMSQQLFFEHPEQDGFLEAIIQNVPKFDQLLCSFVVLPQIAANSLSPLSQTQMNDGVPAIVQLRPQSFDTTDTKRNLNMRLLNTAKIAQFIETEFPYIAYVATTQSRQKKR